MPTTEEQKVIQALSDLNRDIQLWLQDNRDLPDKERMAAVECMLEDAEPAVLLHYAACSFVITDKVIAGLDDMASARNDEASARNDWESASNNWSRSVNVVSRIAEYLSRTAMDHIEAQHKQRKSANKVRVDKFQTIKDDLKKYWQDHIPLNKKATEAARILERSDIYNNSDTKPTQTVLARYVREWQRVQK